MDIPATSAAVLVGLNRKTTQRIYSLLRGRIVEMAIQESRPFVGDIEFDESYFGSRVLEVMDGHDAEAAEMLWEIIPDDVFEKINAVCLDMSSTFASVARAMAPHIKVVHDRFHVSKHLNEAVDQVRRKENKILQDEGDERLKGARHLFLFNPENLPESRASQFEDLKNADLKTSRAWAMKENFGEFWKCSTFQEAAAYFKKWKRWVMKSVLPEMKKVAKMLAKHLEGVLNFTLFPITNAIAEWFNSKIQSPQGRCPWLPQRPQIPHQNPLLLR